MTCESSPSTDEPRRAGKRRAAGRLVRVSFWAVVLAALGAVAVVGVNGAGGPDRSTVMAESVIDVTLRSEKTIRLNPEGNAKFLEYLGSLRPCRNPFTILWARHHPHRCQLRVKITVPAGREEFACFQTGTVMLMERYVNPHWGDGWEAGSAQVLVADEPASDLFARLQPYGSPPSNPPDPFGPEVEP